MGSKRRPAPTDPPTLKPRTEGSARAAPRSIERLPGASGASGRIAICFYLPEPVYDELRAIAEPRDKAAEELIEELVVAGLPGIREQGES